MTEIDRSTSRDEIQKGRGIAAGHSRLLWLLSWLIIGTAVCAVCVMAVRKREGLSPDFVEGVSSLVGPEYDGKPWRFRVRWGADLVHRGWPIAYRERYRIIYFDVIDLSGELDPVPAETSRELFEVWSRWAKAQGDSQAPPDERRSTLAAGALVADVLLAYLGALVIVAGVRMAVARRTAQRATKSEKVSG